MFAGAICYAWRKHGCETDVIVIALNSEIEIMAQPGKLNPLDPIFTIQ